MVIHYLKSFVCTIKLNEVRDIKRWKMKCKKKTEKVYTHTHTRACPHAHMCEKAT